IQHNFLQQEWSRLQIKVERDKQLYLLARLRHAESEVQYLKAELKESPEFTNDDACEKK
ncbi:hypothetical protein DXG01_016460, partial [Tephrocybe rancida]